MKAMFWMFHGSAAGAHAARPAGGGAVLRRKPSWWRRLSWRGAVVVAAACFVVGYPLYTYLDVLLTGGISHRGDLLVVDLKAMSSFEMNQESGVTGDIPSLYRNLDGKRVLLTGQMWDPYTTAGQIRTFTLVYSISNCCFNGPPKIQHFVLASVPPGKNVEFCDGFVDVVGKLHVGVQSAAGRVQSVYRIDVEKVQRE
jgi:hypothetical protein